MLSWVIHADYEGGDIAGKINNPRYIFLLTNYNILIVKSKQLNYC